jgi:xanthine dehydrogenase accessory factor
MNRPCSALDDFFAECVEDGIPLVLATVVQTIGSTYRKAGAQMLIAADGRSAGLLSGGCLESDLLERARSVLDTKQALVVDYDSRSSDDLLWGLGLGCEGAMRILLSRLDAASGYEPYAFQVRCRQNDRTGRIALTVATETDRHPLGLAYRSDALDAAPAALHRMLTDLTHGPATTETVDGATFLITQVERPLRLLILGGGPDAVPLVDIAALLGWHITVRDHRAAYAGAERFPRAHRVEHADAASLEALVSRERFDAAVVMSHHLPSDQRYLAALATCTVPYIGLLGPAPRRMRLLAELGTKAQALEGRLYGPVGLDIGATTPEAIALAIAGEIQAVKAGRQGGSFSRAAH